MTPTEFILSLTAIAISFWGIRIAVRRPSLSYDVTETSIIEMPTGSEDAGLAATYRGVTVRRLTASEFLFWNSGHATITDNVLVQDAPLRIELVGEGEIFSADIVAKTADGLGVALQRDEADKTVATRFHFLNAKDGFRVRLLHSGAVGGCAVMGALKGIQGGPRYTLSRHPIIELLVSIIASVLAILPPLIICISRYNETSHFAKWMPRLHFGPPLITEMAVSLITFFLGLYVQKRVLAMFGPPKRLG